MSVSAEVRVATLYDGCGLDALRWLDREPNVGVDLFPLDLTGVALRDYLVDLGVRGPVADRLLFEVIAGHKDLERPLVGAPLDIQEMTLPSAMRGEVLDGIPKNVVYVDEFSVRVRSRMVAKRNDAARLTDLISEEKQALASTLDERSEGVLVVADRDTAWPLIEEIVEAVRTASGPDVRSQTVYCAVLRDDPVFRLQAIRLPQATELGPDATLQEVLLEAMVNGDEVPEFVAEARPKRSLDPQMAPEKGLSALKSPADPATAEEGGRGQDPSGDSGARAERGPRIRMAKTTVDGKLDKEVLRRTFKAHLNELRGCYEEGLVKEPKLKGRVTIEFVIDGTGGVTSSKVTPGAAMTTLDDERVGSCIANAVKRWKFSRPSDGADVTVGLPVVLWPG